MNLLSYFRTILFAFTNKYYDSLSDRLIWVVANVLSLYFTGFVFVILRSTDSLTYLSYTKNVLKYSSNAASSVTQL